MSFLYGRHVINFMDEISKIKALDACTDGDLLKLKQLIGDDFDQFNKLCMVLKRLPDGDNPEIQFTHTDTVIQFKICCNTEGIDVTSLKEGIDGIGITKTKKGVTVSVAVT